MQNKYKTIKRKNYIMTAVTFILIALVFTVIIKYISNKKEPFTTKQMLAKNNWTKDELSDAVARTSLQIKTNDKSNNNLFKHLRNNIKKLPENEREEVISKSIEKSIVRGINMLKSMEPDKRGQVIEKIRKETERNRRDYESMNTDEKKKLESKYKDKYKDSYYKTANETLLNNTTPDERREVAPLVKEWVSFMENL